MKATTKLAIFAVYQLLCCLHLVHAGQYECATPENECTNLVDTDGCINILQCCLSCSSFCFGCITYFESCPKVPWDCDGIDPPTPYPTKKPTTAHPTSFPTKSPTRKPTASPTCTLEENFGGVDGCANDVTCSDNGVCGEGCHGANGNGKCTACIGSSKYGENCDQDVNCNTNNGRCNLGVCNGVLGHGSCDECDPGYYSPNCDKRTKCDPNNGICLQNTCYGPEVVASKCDSCKTSNYFGEYCTNKVSCVNGECSLGSCHGPKGNGHCDAGTCADGWLGDDCDIPHVCVLEHAVDGEFNEATGECIECLPGFFGEACDSAVSCNLELGTCGLGSCYGVNATRSGECDTCADNAFGSVCSPVRCHATQGVCSVGTCSGTQGTGDCTDCTVGFYGDTCSDSSQCSLKGTCSKGTCWGVEGTGKCDPDSCEEGFGGVYCDSSTDETITDSEVTGEDSDSDDPKDPVKLVSDEMIGAVVGATSVVGIAVVVLVRRHAKSKTPLLSMVTNQETHEGQTEVETENPMFVSPSTV